MPLAWRMRLTDAPYRLAMAESESPRLTVWYFLLGLATGFDTGLEVGSAMGFDVGFEVGLEMGSAMGWEATRKSGCLVGVVSGRVTEPMLGGKGFAFGGG